MGTIRDRMDGDLRLRGLSEVTRAEYLRCVGHFSRLLRCTARAARCRRRAPLHAAPGRHAAHRPREPQDHIAAIKFLYNVTLDRPEVVARVRFPKVPLKLLDIPSPTEVAAVLSELDSPVYRTLLFCAYGAGLRVSEACNLCVGDIDSKRMVIIVRDGKGGRDRYADAQPGPARGAAQLLPPGAPATALPLSGQSSRQAGAGGGRADRAAHGAGTAVASPNASLRTPCATPLPRTAWKPAPICA